jgi:hypothetical protein
MAQSNRSFCAAFIQRLYVFYTHPRSYYPAIGLACGRAVNGGRFLISHVTAIPGSAMRDDRIGGASYAMPPDYASG